MNKSDLIEAVSAQTDVSKTQTGEALDAVTHVSLTCSAPKRERCQGHICSHKVTRLGVP
jgi:nucleoid DNA-binding protein